MLKYKSYLVIFLLHLTACANLSLNMQNDIVGRTDNNFTNGFELKYSQKPEDLPKDLTAVLDYLPVPRIKTTDPKETTRYTFSLRQDIYTPNNLEETKIVKDENPYAGTLTIDIQKVMADTKKRISTKLRLGTSGYPSLAGSTQIFVHDNLTKLGKKQRHPSGWDNQVSAEPLINLDYERTWEDFRATLYGLDIVEQGTALTRLGNINTDFNLLYSWKMGYNVPYLNNETSKEFSLYSLFNLFSSIRYQNIYYDGGMFRTSPQTVDKELMLHGIEAGVAIGYDNYTVKFIYDIQTKEYKEQHDKYHSFGWITFGVTW